MCLFFSDSSVIDANPLRFGRHAPAPGGLPRRLFLSFGQYVLETRLVLWHDLTVLLSYCE